MVTHVYATAICTCGDPIQKVISEKAHDRYPTWRHMDGYIAFVTGEKRGVLQSHHATPKRWWRRWDKAAQMQLAYRAVQRHRTPEEQAVLDAN